MITTKQLKTLDDFQSIKKGDYLACEFHREVHDYPKSYKFNIFKVYAVKHNTSEIILQKKNNIYFNYNLFLGIESGNSNLLNAVLINQK